MRKITILALLILVAAIGAGIELARSQGSSVAGGGIVGGTTLVITFTGFTFSQIATSIPNNGMIGYCSDCTIANPCASGGSGAIAKRLNGINVCN